MVIKNVNLEIVCGITSKIPDTAYNEVAFAGVSTIAKIVQETCDVLWKVLQPLEMAEPTTNDWLDISKGFYEKTNFPNTVGAVCLFICIPTHFIDLKKTNNHRLLIIDKCLQNVGIITL